MAIMSGTSARWLRPLLLVTLLFGLATMHTVGHPALPVASAAPAPVSASAPGADAAPVAAPASGADAVPVSMRDTVEAPASRSDAAPVPAPAPAAAWDSVPAPAPGRDAAPMAASAPVPPRAEPNSTSSAAQGGTGHPETSVHEPGVQTASAPGAGAGTASAHSPAGHDGRDGSDRSGGHAMDPTLVCLAVLGAWGAALLVIAGVWLARWRARVETAGHEGWSASTRDPLLRPPGVTVARVAVLRI
ncbi:hypothetical protein ACFVIM_14830 [Streptomyces sp. NPDC057638]|uniref:hypothetical protein n=1 Tax=Streptomyces sp. NPDC057638 TaxID=3346190 RepID=UPI003676C4F8